MTNPKLKTIILIDLNGEDYNKPLDAFLLGRRIIDALAVMNLDLLVPPLRLNDTGWKKEIYRGHLLFCLEQVKRGGSKPVIYIQDIPRMRNSKHGYLLEILEDITIVRSIDDLLCEASRE